jgi:hypothetical protein
MSSNTSSKAVRSSRFGRSRLAAAVAACALSVGMGAVSVAAAPAANAGNPAFPQSRTVGPCTVTAETPKAVREDSAGHTVVRYRATVNCTAGGLRVKMEQRLMERDDPGRDDEQRPGYTVMPGTPLNFREPGVKRPFDDFRLVRSDLFEGANEEVYHKVRFQLVSDNGIKSDWFYVQSHWKSIRR